MSARDAYLSRGWNMVDRDSPEAVIAEQFAARDPIAATRALARGLACQTSGGQLTALRLLAETLVRRDPTLAHEIAHDLRDLAGKEAAA